MTNKSAKSDDTYLIDVEYTDTFDGEANYCWVKREELCLPCGLSNLAIMRRAKAAMGISGMRGQSSCNGDSWEFRPYRSCTVMFARVIY